MPSKIDLTNTMPSPPASPPPPPQRISRPLLHLPEVALFHSTNFLEESLFSQAFSNLTSCLTSGLSTNSPAYIPTPSVLALAATVSVHPSYTTRTADKDRWRDADSAARYLRCMVDVIDGREESGVKEAFEFKETTRKSVGRGRRRGGAGADSGIDMEGERALAGKYAHQQSLWSCAGDFWSVVGWAMNCSVKYRGRWERWKGWLEVMLDVLERDLDRSMEREDVKNCLLHTYLQTIGGGRNDQRRMMRAILADGSVKSVSEFGEIWRNETRAPRVEDAEERESNNTKKRKLDLENGEYGDYFDEDSAAEEDCHPSPTRRSRSAHSKPRRGPSAGSSDASSSLSMSSATGNVELFGGYDSLRLRQRFLSLLATFSNTAPKLLGADLSDVWSLYTEFLRPLPLPIFQQFISPLKAYLSPAWQASLCEMMSRALLGISGSYGIVTRESFEQDIVRATANNSTVVDNAKVGVLVEGLLRLLWMQGFLDDPWEGVRDVIEEGIRQRDVKANWRKKGAGEEEAREGLRLSAARLRLLGRLICS